MLAHRLENILLPLENEGEPQQQAIEKAQSND
jgi:hypothetical protein